MPYVLHVTFTRLYIPALGVQLTKLSKERAEYTGAKVKVRRRFSTSAAFHTCCRCY